MLEEVLLILWSYHHSLCRASGAYTYGGEPLPWATECEGKANIDLSNQVKIGPYRVDFLIVVTPPKGKVVKFAIECDGHNFHERTAEQAVRDRSRDRRLLREGVVTLRYTYHELAHQSMGCMKDLWETLKAFTTACQP